MSELIKEFRKSGLRTFEEWRKWYSERYPNAIDEATDKVWNMINNFKITLEQLDRDKVRKWVEDLVLIKTYEGLMLQDAILEKVAKELGGDYRLATPEEEAKGIDGIIIIENREIPVSIKPQTYVEQERHLPEELEGHLIVYKKAKDGVVVDYSKLLKSVSDK